MFTLRGPDGEPAVSTTDSPVTRVTASTWRDAMFGLGFVHGRDRGAQIELMKVLAEGRLCERLVDSEQALRLDRYFRRLGLAQDAGRNYPQLGEPYRGYLAAYAAGLNRARARHYPWLYRLVTGRPEQYRPQDVLLLLKLTAYLGLAEGQRIAETFVLHALKRGVDSALLRHLFPALQDDAAGLLAQVRHLPPLYPGDLFGIGGSGGSNAWVVSGARSASGFPLLANDPHLEVNRLPAVIYPVQLAVGDERVDGATLPGTPGFVSGRNRHLAWGVTYSCADTCDFFVEHLEGDHAVVDRKPQPLETAVQTIRRKSHADETLIRLCTPSGVLEALPPSGAALSWRWVGQGDAGLASIRAFTDLLHCRTIEQASACMRGVDIPTLHVLFADRSGSIGYQLVGAIPKRRRGWSGLGPAAGFDGAQGWSGLRDAASEHPCAANPDSGFIAVTNDAGMFADHPGISTCWLASYRTDRIAGLLRARRDFRPADFQRMQYDVCSEQARLFVPEYVAHMPDGAAKRLLQSWDLEYRPDSTAATLFERLHESVVHQVFGARFGNEWFTHVLASTGLYSALIGFFDRVLLSRDSPWLPGAQRASTLAAAIGRVLQQPGPIPPWGEVNVVTLTNLFFGGKLPAWLRMDRGPYPLPGNHATISQGNRFQAGGRNTSFAPCYRMVADLANGDLWSNYPGGPRESRFSPGYASVFDDWVNGTYRRGGGGDVGRQ